MRKKLKFIPLLLLVLAGVLFSTFYLKDITIAVLDPQGVIGLKERHLLITATLLMCIVVVPVFLLTFAFVWRYREGNEKAKYTPEWCDSPMAEVIWWGIPCVIIGILSVMTWRGCYELDPFRPLASEKKALPVQVIALQWKWLFLYPEQKIATLNYLRIPEKTPIHFYITSDAPMNSFWIPDLGGQIFAMPAMNTELFLNADTPGEFRGCSANISGRGFSGMTFMTKATTQEDFDHWVQETQQTPTKLTHELYQHLMQPSSYDPETSYVLEADGLYDQVLMKYMVPMNEQSPPSDEMSRPAHVANHG